ncbi:MAG: hypothetical protein IKV16_02905 [Clostridia bacterium]|nr:hypothetical protein [Clostridia bacterium]
MSNYLGTLVAISALVGVCSYISYGIEKSKTVKFAVSAILICTLVNPLAAMISEIDISLSKSESDAEISFGDSAVYDGARNAFCDGVRRYICESFSLSESEVEIILFEFDPFTMKAEKIKVILYGTAAFADNRAIDDLITSAGLGECEVEVSVK